MMRMPEHRQLIAMVARCRPGAIQLLNVGRGRRSWRIPVFTKGQKYMSLLWCPEHGMVKNTPEGLRAYRSENTNVHR